MTRPLTGAREMFRRLQENQEARRRRTNEVREMGGLEPLPDQPTQEEYFQNYFAGRLDTALRDYQLQLLRNIRDYHPYTITARAPRATITPIEGAVAPIEPIRIRDWADMVAPYEVPRERPHPYYSTWFDDEDDWLTPYKRKTLSNEDRVVMREITNGKLENNDDFSFLLNKDD